MSNVVNDVKIAVSDVANELSRLETVYAQRKGQLVGVLQSHIADHQKQAAAHAAEIAATQAVLAKAVPQAAPVADQAAAIILTAPSGVQKAVTWVASNWRYPAIAALVSGIGYALHTGLVHL